MYNILRVNKRYSIDLQGNVKLDDVKIVDKDSTEKVTIEIEGKLFKLCPIWLGLIAHYQVEVSVKDLFNISFVKCVSKLLRYRCENKMVFNKPIIYKPGFRVVPDLMRYAVSRNGEVISINTDRSLKIQTGPNGYPVVNLYDPDKNRYRSVGVHILVARSWVVNRNPTINHVVNHKDGNKTNYHYLNLEWTNGVKNNIHARDTGLTSDNINCTLYDTETHKFVDFPSISEAAKAIGYIRSSIKTTIVLNGVKQLRLIFGRYYLIRKDCEFKIEDVKTFLEFKRTANKGPYEVLCIKSGETMTLNSVPEITRHIGINESNIYHALGRGPSYPVGDFLVRVKTDKPWPKPVPRKVINRPVSIEARKDGKSLVFKSIREATTHLECDKSTITKRLKSPDRFGAYEGWTFKKIVTI
ncbi:hypothetical protein AGENTSMITH_112 [Bacillus phage vB_BspM_AgentSmith]|nr:hypothetical protein AGENTSMITH_112 [Bacillus phage vB_BspM_AgentSmith]